MKRIVSVGGGIASTLLLPLDVVWNYGIEDTELVMAVLPNEHPDVWRLCDRAEELTGVPISYIAYDPDAPGKWRRVDKAERTSGELWTPMDMFFKHHMLGSSRVDPCSSELKRKTVAAYITANYQPGDAVIYVGIGADEIERFAAIRDGWGAAGYETAFPLMNWTEMDRENAILACELLCGFVPELYTFGDEFSHNNCFAYETRYLTIDGVKSLGETVGTSQTILSKNGYWHEAEIRSFGRQRLLKLTLGRRNQRKEIYVTANHRWITHDGARGTHYVDRTTGELSPGVRIKGQGTRSVLKQSNQWGGDSVCETWHVIAVEQTDRFEEVYCAVVPETHEFTLEDYIATGNCAGACVKAGHRQWLALLQRFPDVYAEWELGEIIFRARFGDYSILRDRRGGETRPLTLYALRKQFELEQRQRAGDVSDLPMFAWLSGTPACSFCDAAVPEFIEVMQEAL